MQAPKLYGERGGVVWIGTCVGIHDCVTYLPSALGIVRFLCPQVGTQPHIDHFVFDFRYYMLYAYFFYIAAVVVGINQDGARMDCVFCDL